MRDFNKEAATWDEQPGRVAIANNIGASILRQIKLDPSMDVMEFGCGTGLITVQFQPHVHSITGVDNSDGMLGVLNAKIAASHLDNVKVQTTDVVQGGILQGNYHLVVTSMAVHHIPETLPLFEQFFQVLLPGGQLAIADLDLDDGQFHKDNLGVYHMGFDRAALRSQMQAAGFESVQDSLAAEVTRPIADGTIRTFTIFLMTAIKPA